MISCPLYRIVCRDADKKAAASGSSKTPAPKPAAAPKRASATGHSLTTLAEDDEEDSEEGSSDDKPKGGFCSGCIGEASRCSMEHAAQGDEDKRGRDSTDDELMTQGLGTVLQR